MVLLEKNAVTVCDGNTQESEAAVSVRNGNGLSKLSGLVSKRALYKLKEPYIDSKEPYEHYKEP